MGIEARHMAQGKRHSPADARKYPAGLNQAMGGRLVAYRMIG
jgi:hypothetical protein